MITTMVYDPADRLRSFELVADLATASETPASGTPASGTPATDTPASRAPASRASASAEGLVS
jgi:hypothetical protein